MESVHTTMAWAARARRETRRRRRGGRFRSFLVSNTLERLSDILMLCEHYNTDPLRKSPRAPRARRFDPAAAASPHQQARAARVRRESRRRRRGGRSPFFFVSRMELNTKKRAPARPVAPPAGPNRRRQSPNVRVRGVVRGVAAAGDERRRR